MFVRLTRFQGKVDMIDEAVKRYEESVVPAAKSQKGYQKLYFLLNRKTGKAVSIAFWDNKENAIANERSLYYQEQLIKFVDFIKKPYIREGYEVVVKA